MGADGEHVTGPYTDRRAALLAEIATFLKRVADQQDLISILAPETTQKARELAGLVSDNQDDVESRFLLGWLHWYRYLALPESQDEPELESAINMLAPCMLAGVALQEFPGPLLPALADTIMPVATALLAGALSSADNELISAVVNLWVRILAATPDVHADKARRLANLGLAFRTQYERTGTMALLEEAIQVGRQAVAAGADEPDPAGMSSNLGIALRLRFDRTGALPDLEEAIANHRATITTTPDEHPDRAARLYDLEDALQARFRRTGALPDLDEAIQVARQAVAATPSGHPNRAAMLSSLVIALDIRYERTGALPDLDEAIREGREAIAATPGDHPNRAVQSYRLGIDLRTRFGRTGAVPDLDEAVKAVREAIAATREDHPDRAVMLSTLGITLRLRSGQTGMLADLDEAVQVGREAIAAAPEHPSKATMLFGLGSALQSRSEMTGTVADLDEAIRVGREAIAATPGEHPDRAIMLASLGSALRAQFGRTGALATLDESITNFRSAIELTSGGHPERNTILSDLGNALSSRFERTGVPADQDEAIQAYREAIAADPGGGPGRAPRLSDLRNALLSRFKRTGIMADLDEAIQAGREATAVTPSGHPDSAARLANLAAALQIRYRRTGTLADLNEAITNLREANALTHSGQPERATMLLSLARALGNRFERTVALPDLEEAIQLSREAVAASTPGTGSDHADMLSNLGASLRLRFGQTGSLPDLEEAVQLGREAVAASTPGTDSDRAARLANLADTLRTRSEHTDALSDLDQAIVYHRQAISVMPGSDPDRVSMLSHLGAVLHDRFRRTGSLPDLEEAITRHREAIAASAADAHPDRCAWLSNLGAALQVRFQHIGERPDLEEAITHHREAIAASAADAHPDRCRWLSNLGTALWTRFEQTGVLPDLDEAIGAIREAIAVTSDDHPQRAAFQYNLGSALQARFERTGEQADTDEAIDVLGRAMDIETGPASVRIQAARAASDLAAGSRPEWAADLMERAVRLLPEVAPRQLERGDQQYALGGLSGLAGDAAALVLAVTSTPPAERAALALQLLEAGRAVLFSQALEVRSDLTDLGGQHPDLAARFTRLRELLDGVTEDRRRLAGELAAVVAEIRNKEGFGSFARPPSITELIEQAAAGPVVVFNVSRYRSDALLLTEDGVISLPLPELAMDRVIPQVSAFHQALHSATRGKTSPERATAQQQLNQILGWLWDAAAGPVLNALGYRTQPAPGTPWPRLWWVPGGLMSLLPIHAAGYHDDPADHPGGRAVIDRVISSYTPTIAALRYARRAIPAPLPAGQDGIPPTLIVAMPSTPGLPGHGRLRFVRDEAALLATKLPAAITLTEPDGDDVSSAAIDPGTMPTRANVLALLATCPAAHFACHGANDPADPSRSRLLLHDHREAPLTVSALASVHLDHARLAYLSACDTALSASVQLIDEAVHLASAFQLAGYPHVIGTLWAIDDYVAVRIADAFYAALTNSKPVPDIDVIHAALALHQAVRAVRATYPGTPSLWASHIHAGA